MISRPIIPIATDLRGSGHENCSTKIEPDLEDFQNPLKVFHHLERVLEIKNGRICAPLHMTIGFTNHCNHKCSWCYINYNQAGKIAERSGALGLNTKSAINADYRIIESVRQAKEIGLRSVTIVGDGEPTLHPRFIEYLAELAKLDLKIGIFSNLSYKDSEISDSLLESTFFLRGSIDAASASVHEAQHGSRDFDRVIDNLNYLIRRRSKNSPAIGVQYVVNEKNIHEIKAAALFYKNLGVDYISFKPAYKNELNVAHEENKLRYEDVEDTLRFVQELRTDSFKVYAKLPQFKESLGYKYNEGRYYKRCHATPLSPYLDEDGSLELCGNLKGRGFRIGNVYELDFKDLWGSQRHKELLDSIDLAKCPAGCKLDPVNKVLWNALYPDDSTNHIDFI